MLTPVLPARDDPAANLDGDLDGEQS